MVVPFKGGVEFLPLEAHRHGDCDKFIHLYLRLQPGHHKLSPEPPERHSVVGLISSLQRPRIFILNN
jgi:hypothetical protein